MVYPLETNITWVSGFDSMTTYTFGKERIAHSFCSTCGTSMGGKSTNPNFFADNRAVNVSSTTRTFSTSSSSLGAMSHNLSLGGLCSHSKAMLCDVLVILLSWRS